jgi:Spy/CpxP family protein refolding chaperone
MSLSIRTVLSASLVLGALVLGTAGSAYASPNGRGHSAAGEHSATKAHGKGGGKGGQRGQHGHHANVFTKAQQLTSLSAAQKAQVDQLANENKADRDTLKAPRAKVMTAVAAQIDKGAIDRAALRPALADQTNALVAAKLRKRAREEKLHTVLTAAQCAEVGGGQDFLGPKPVEAELRTKADAHSTRFLDRLEKKVPSMTPAERAAKAAALRTRAAK